MQDQLGTVNRSQARRKRWFAHYPQSIAISVLVTVTVLVPRPISSQLPVTDLFVTDLSHETTKGGHRHHEPVQLAAHRKPWQAGPQPPPLLPRLEARAICALSYQEPPRPTRNRPIRGPWGSTASAAAYGPYQS